MIQLVDSHCHLAGPEFDADRDEVIARAQAARVKYVVVIGTGSSYDEMAAAVRMVQRIEGGYGAAGIHPHDASRFLDDDLAGLRKLARGQKFIALGEIGLDYHYDRSPREAQQRILIRQLELGRELKLPVIIHCREAWQDLRRIVTEHWRSSGLGGILHCFTGEREDAFDLLDSGFMVSLAGNLTFKKADGLREVARALPADRLLTETDSPYLAPVPHRGKRNQPAFVGEVLRQLATIRGASEEEMGAQVLDNFTRLIGTRNVTANG